MQQSSQSHNPKEPESSDKTLEIRLGMPSLSSFAKLGSSLKKLCRKLSPKLLLLAVVCIVVLVAALATFVLPKVAPKDDDYVVIQSEKINDKPVYNTVLPAGKSIKELGGWKRVSPPDRNPVFAFADIVGGVEVAVSQQPLPGEFKKNTDDAIADLAKSYNATGKATVGDTIVYIGTSAKGPQSVIFTKNDLLILIKSQKKIDSKAWARYIQSLQ